MDESMVMVCMQIITNTGSAKSSYIEAIQKAKKGDLGGAEISMNEGDDLYGRKLYNGSGQWHKYTNTPI